MSGFCIGKGVLSGLVDLAGGEGLEIVHCLFDAFGALLHPPVRLVLQLLVLALKHFLTVAQFLG